MKFPLTLTFRILTLGQRIQVSDADGTSICHVQQKAFRLKEDVVIYPGAEQRGEALYRIHADRIIDVGATYRITNGDDQPIGAVRQRGIRSFWRATYDVVDANDQPVAQIREEDPWKKVIDGLIGEIPIVGIIAGMIVNPSYVVEAPVGTPVLRVLKRRSLIERSFVVQQIAPVPARLEPVLVPSLLMMTLLERGRG